MGQPMLLDSPEQGFILFGGLMILLVIAAIGSKIWNFFRGF